MGVLRWCLFRSSLFLSKVESNEKLSAGWKFRRQEEITELLNELQSGGEVFLSNAIVNEKYCLRACVVNFRTSKKDIEEIVEIVVKVGQKVHSILLKTRN